MRNLTVLLLAGAALAAPKRLYGIPWHDSVPEAQKKADGKKPILWLRMLGDLAGKT